MSHKSAKRCRQLARHLSHPDANELVRLFTAAARTAGATPAEAKDAAHDLAHALQQSPSSAATFLNALSDGNSAAGHQRDT